MGCQGACLLTCGVKILHGELEAQLLSTQGELVNAEVELEKQRALNEKLENDLLQIQTHNPGSKAVNGDSTPAADDVLAGLDLGKKPGVSEMALALAIFVYSYGLLALSCQG